MNNKTIEEVFEEAHYRLPDPTEYKEETCVIKVYHDATNYTAVHFEKVYGANHERSVDWLRTDVIAGKK